MQIRDAFADDYDAYARLFLELGVDDPVPPRERFAAEIAPRALVACAGEAVVGYAVFDVYADSAHVRNLVSDPAWRRRGVGAAIMQEVRARCSAAGVATWELNVKPDNVAARALYARLGMREVYRTHVLRVPRELALPAPPPELSVDDLRADEDAAVEARFGLLRGQLATARPRSGRRVLALRRAPEVVGVGVLATVIPGSFPFRCAAPELGVPFAALLRPLVAAAAPCLQVGVEGDEPLAAAITAAGAETRMVNLHLRGAP